ncbi:MbnP family protein [Chitinophaga cymbidii]|uniref:Copper-binding protein MbnP-like domain-containing protein n=1 Tax=Chitinophaga cymbidii TaxID=1096750 RepID=A0A512RDJ9_9BACT|nr:MbnP family protein [Chitinophaga cymbidii]GEP93788.1 hypothetical protein CCY01nite_00480 [Chitinophaga cymbidii]
MKPLYFLTACLFLFAACRKDTVEQGTMELEFRNVAGNQPLTLNTATYQNAEGENFTISAFKYYLSNFSLVKMDNSEVKLPAAYFLVDQANEASRVIKLAAPKGEYRAVKFLVGVDSTRNVSGAQTGALDVVHGMFWSWNSGYIMAKLEGYSPASTAPENRLTFHIGGFRKENSAIQEVLLTAPISLTVESGRLPQLMIDADALAWFNQPFPIKFATTSTIHVPGEDAAKIAANYRNMFRITSVTDL